MGLRTKIDIASCRRRGISAEAPVQLTLSRMVFVSLDWRDLEVHQLRKSFISESELGRVLCSRPTHLKTNQLQN